MITHTHQEEASHIPQDDLKRRAEEDVRKRIVILPADSPQNSFVVNRDRDLPTKTGLWNSPPKTGKSNLCHQSLPTNHRFACVSVQAQFQSLNNLSIKRGEAATSFLRSQITDDISLGFF